MHEEPSQETMAGRGRPGPDGICVVACAAFARRSRFVGGPRHGHQWRVLEGSLKPDVIVPSGVRGRLKKMMGPRPLVYGPPPYQPEPILPHFVNLFDKKK